MGFPRTVSVFAIVASLLGPARSVAAAEETRTSVLGLDGVTESYADLDSIVTAAVARQSRVLVEGLSLAELRLALDCGSNEPRCLARARTMLEVDELVYGELTGVADGKPLLRVWRLDVEAGVLLGSATLPLSGKKGAALERDVEEMVVVLFEELPEDEEALIAGPTEPTTDPAPPVAVTPEPTPVAQPNDGPRWEWGTYSPQPWKLAGVGTSGGVAVVGIVMWATAAGMLRDRGSIRSDLVAAVEGSTEDSNAANDIALNSADVCGDAEAPPQAGMGNVRNVAVAEVCLRADRTRRVGLAGIGLTAVGVVGALAFTALLFVRPRQARRQATVRPFLWSGQRASGAGVTGRF